MKYLLISVCCLYLIISCSPEDPFYSGKMNSQNLIDSTFDPRLEKWLFEEDVPFTSNVDIPPIDCWEEAIRVQGRTGWPGFEYVCSIYNEERPRLQLIGHRRLHNLRDLTIINEEPIFRERFLKQNEYDSIINELVVQGFTEMPTDFYPEWSCSDCTSFSIAIKNRSYRKYIKWASTDVEKHSSLNQKKALNFYYNLLEYAGLPKPKVILKEETNKSDSIVYNMLLDDHSLAWYFNIKLSDYFKLKARLTGSLKSQVVVSKQDTSMLSEHIKVYGLQGVEDTMWVDVTEIKRIASIDF